MEFCNRLNKIFVLFFAFLLLVSFALADFQKTENILAIEEDGITTLTFQQSDQMEMISIQGNHYTNAKPDSFIKVVNGSISEADLTATNRTSWTFGNDTLTVEAGTRVVYKDGKLEIFGKEGESFILRDRFQGERNEIQFGKNAELTFQDRTFSGKNFEVDGIQVKEGRLSVVQGGYILGENSLAEWKGLTLGNGKDLFLATSENSYNSWEGSALFPEDLRLRGRGEDFEIRLKEGDDCHYAVVEFGDNFEIKAIHNFEFELLNRNPDLNPNGKIPLMNVKGEFMVNQDYKTIYTQEGNVLIKREGVLFGQGEKYDDTSPIELFISERKEKYIVNNFGGIATLGLNELSGNTETRYANSIYFQRAFVEHRYNYPTFETFEDITGKSLIPIFDNANSVNPNDFGNLNNPFEYSEVSTLLDYYETLPEEVKDKITTIKFYDRDAWKSKMGDEWRASIGSYDKITGTINLFSEESDLDLFRHEVGHMTHDLLLINPASVSSLYVQRGKIESDFWNSVDVKYYQSNLVGKTPDQLTTQEREIYNRVNRKYEDYLNQGYDDLKFNNNWMQIAGGADIYSRTTIKSYASQSKEIVVSSVYLPNHGFVKPYGATDYKEDVATFIGTIIGDPAFFQKNNLLQDENSIYFQKIKLLHQYGFITDKEYDSVLNPEKYGLK
jgi:hypothetical protein